MKSSALDAQPHRGPLLAGWSRIAIVAPDHGPLAGYGERADLPHVGASGPLFVRAFFFEVGAGRVIVFAADLLLTERDLASAVRERLHEIDPDLVVFFTATHTHSGPGGYVKGKVFELALGRFDPSFLDTLSTTYVAAAQRAMSGKAPARVGVAEISVEGLSQNRIERAGPVDNTLFILRLEHADGTAAAFASFPCHPTTTDRSDLRLSADFPGLVAEALEAEDVEVMGLAAGGVGSSEPRRTLSTTATTSYSVEVALRLTSAMRRGLKQARRQARSVVDLAAAQAKLPCPPLRYRLTKDWMLPGPLVQSVVGFGELEFGVLRLSDNALLFLPVEISGELSSAVRRTARKRGLTLAVLPFDGTYAGYVGARRAYDLPEERTLPLFRYETKIMTFFGPWAGDWVVNLGLRLLRGTLRD